MRDMVRIGCCRVRTFFACSMIRFIAIIISLIGIYIFYSNGLSAISEIMNKYMDIPQLCVGLVRNKILLE